MELEPELQEDCNEEACLLSIPTELRVIVYRHLDYDDTLRMRLVNKKIREEVDEHMEFHIRLDQAYRGFRKLCRYRVNSCTVIRLTHQHLHHGGLFSHPIRLKKIVFDGNISQTNLLKILSHCNEIEHLGFTHETLGIENLLQSVRVEQCFRRNLSLVTHLNIQLLRYPLGNPFEPERNIDTILSLTLPHLKSFKLYFSLWGKWLPLLLFLERHAGSLNEIELQVGDRGDSKNTQMFLHSNPHSRLKSSLNMKTLKSLRLQKFNFRDDVLNLNVTVKQILMEILQDQKTLQVLQFHSPGDMTINHLKAIVSNNERTLTEVVVYNLRNFIENPINNNNNNQQQDALQGLLQHVRIVMDMSIFQRCLNLKTLALSCTSSNGHVQNAVELGNIRLSNLNLIPRTIERMHLTGFLLNLDEIVNMSTLSPSMKELLVADAGIMRYSTVLRSFLRNCPKLEYLNVRPVVTGASSDSGWFSEVEELSKLYGHFMGIPFDPIDDLEGFEAKITDLDRIWIRDNYASSSPTNSISCIPRI